MEIVTDKGGLLKNIDYARALAVKELVDFQEGTVVSRTLAQNKALSLTVFAFDQGEGISAHTVTADAFVQILEGEAAITIGGQTVRAKAGEVVAMPEGVPHSLKAEKRFKMLLLVVRRVAGLED